MPSVSDQVNEVIKEIEEKFEQSFPSQYIQHLKTWVTTCLITIGVTEPGLFKYEMERIKKVLGEKNA